MPHSRSQSEIVRTELAFLRKMDGTDPSAVLRAKELVKMTHPDRWQHPRANEFATEAIDQYRLIRESAKSLPEFTKSRQTEKDTDGASSLDKENVILEHFRVVVSFGARKIVPFEKAAAMRRSKKNGGTTDVSLPKFISGDLFVSHDKESWVPIHGTTAAVPLDAENGKIMNVPCFPTRNRRERGRKRMVRAVIHRNDL